MTSEPPKRPKCSPRAARLRRRALPSRVCCDPVRRILESSVPLQFSAKVVRMRIGRCGPIAQLLNPSSAPHLPTMLCALSNRMERRETDESFLSSYRRDPAPATGVAYPGRPTQHTCVLCYFRKLKECVLFNDLVPHFGTGSSFTIYRWHFNFVPSN